MTVARSVADVLADHVVFEVESIDRMYLNVWQPRLAYGGGVQGFFVGHRGYHYASTALMDPMTKAFVNFFYFYCVDADFGPFFLKFSTYFPYTAKLCINGNEWAKRQAAKAQIGFEPLDNGFSSCDDVFALQQICDSLGPVHIEALLRKWLRILPNPFTPEDEDAGYRYELSILQAESSLT